MVSFRFTFPSWRTIASLVLVLLFAFACSGTGSIRNRESPNFLESTQPATIHPTVISQSSTQPATTRPMATSTTEPAKPTDLPLPTMSPTPKPLEWTGPLLVSGRIRSPRDTSMASIPVFDLRANQQQVFPQHLVIGDIDVWGWTPDGCSLLISRANYAQEVYAINIATQETTVLPVFAPYAMKYSPDERWIAYSTFDKLEGNPHLSDVYLVRPDGSETITLASDNELNYYSLSWTRDSQKVLFWASSHSNETHKVRELYAANIYSSELCLVARVPEPLERWEDLYIARIEDCQQIELPYTGPVERANQVNVSYSPNNRYVTIFLAEIFEIAFDGVRVFLLDLETGSMYELQEKEFSLSGMDWSSDGATFAFTGSYANEQDPLAPHLLHLADASTGTVQILEIEGGATHPSWSPDNNLLALQLKSEAAVVYNLVTKEILYLPDVFSARSPLQWSPRMVYGPDACRNEADE